MYLPKFIFLSRIGEFVRESILEIISESELSENLSLIREKKYLKICFITRTSDIASWALRFGKVIHFSIK
ncbi:TPA: hypothetical protein DCZ31_05555 [Patescibacteria group bacterium]|nr:hypothetical protein [Candidatus Gracilibacteria bacterium]